eukprot:CAMPEP_0174272192 /NCGR_PEP_ID=MMETSP0439-20130205/50478_1 /TAXON_ID=0 /ORGANISM="Stereomyxa ramosa, Strain Chinc5" /LENGTH=144 /DNA_ID=CAMNT_0015362637 /DNA_START=23 /DNA_END=454 /DNA_ORIENTATION=+
MPPWRDSKRHSTQPAGGYPSQGNNNENQQRGGGGGFFCTFFGFGGSNNEERVCGLPGCNNEVYVENGKLDQQKYCCPFHAEQHAQLKQNISPSSNPSSLALLTFSPARLTQHPKKKVFVKTCEEEIQNQDIQKLKKQLENANDK